MGKPSEVEEIEWSEIDMIVEHAVTWREVESIEKNRISFQVVTVAIR